MVLIDVLDRDCNYVLCFICDIMDFCIIEITLKFCKQTTKSGNKTKVEKDILHIGK